MRHPGLALIVLALASYRITRLILFDRIMRWPRAFILEQLARTADPRIIATGDELDELDANQAWALFDGSWRRDAAYLIKCSFCAGIWVAGAVCAGWHWLPAVRFPVAFFAVAGLQALLHTWEQDS